MTKTLTAVPSVMLDSQTLTIYEVDSEYLPADNTDQNKMKLFVVGFGLQGPYFSKTWVRGWQADLVDLKAVFDEVHDEIDANQDFFMDYKLVFTNHESDLRQIFV